MLSLLQDSLPWARFTSNRPRRCFTNAYLRNRPSNVFGLPPGYDGGDCCECDCVNGPNFACGSPALDPASCIDPDSLCFDGYVEAGTKTTVGVSANAYDTRPGGDTGGIGCMTDGCLPALVRDGDSDDNESRWSCARTLLPEGGGECSISFTFEDPQDIKEIQVAFWRRAVRSRTLKASTRGDCLLSAILASRSSHEDRSCCLPRRTLPHKCDDVSNRGTPRSRHAEVQIPKAHTFNIWVAARVVVAALYTATVQRDGVTVLAKNAFQLVS